MKEYKVIQMKDNSSNYSIIDYLKGETPLTAWALTVGDGIRHKDYYIRCHPLTKNALASVLRKM